MRILARVIPVLHLVQRFYVGGAERQFIERLRAHPQGFEPVVGCLEISGGNLADFRALGLGEPHHFPLRGSLLSSMAAGLPVVATDATSWPSASSRWTARAPVTGSSTADFWTCPRHTLFPRGRPGERTSL